jgi:hypothetical protein
MKGYNMTHSLLDGCSTLKLETYHAAHMSDVYRLVLHANGSFKVHIERRESFGAVSECILYEGKDLEAANRVFNRYAK